MRSRRYVSVARAVFRRHMHVVFHRPDLVLPSLVFPLFFYIAFAGGLSVLHHAPGFRYYSYDAFQFVFVLLQSAAFGGVFIGFSIAADFDSGFTRRLFAAAGDRSAIFAGYGAAAVVRAVMVFAMVFLVALLTGMRVGGDAIDLLGLFWLAVVVTVAAFLYAVGMMTRFRTMQAAPAMQIPIFIVLMTTPVYVSRNLLTGWIKTASEINPATAIVEAGRSLMAGGAFHLGLALAAAGGLVVLMLGYARRGLRRAESGAS